MLSPTASSRRADAGGGGGAASALTPRTASASKKRKRRRPETAAERHDRIALQQLQQLFPEDEGGLTETTADVTLREFHQYAAKRGFRTDPKQSRLSLLELTDAVDQVKSHMIKQQSSQKHVVRVVHAFVTGTRNVQRFVRQYLRNKEEIITALQRKWERAEHRARASISKEISIKQFDYENVGLVRVVGGTRVHALRGLHNDCWTSVELKRGAIRELWNLRRRQWYVDYKEYKVEAEVRAAKRERKRQDAFEFDLEFHMEEHRAKRVAQRATDFEEEVQMPRFMRTYMAPASISVQEIIDCLELHLINERLGGRQQHGLGSTQGSGDQNRAASGRTSPTSGCASAADNQWVTYYSGLLGFTSKNVNSLIEKGFQLSGKNAQGGANSPRQRPQAYAGSACGSGSYGEITSTVQLNSTYGTLNSTTGGAGGGAKLSPPQSPSNVSPTALAAAAGGGLFPDDAAVVHPSGGGGGGAPHAIVANPIPARRRGPGPGGGGGGKVTIHSTASREDAAGYDARAVTATPPAPWQLRNARPTASLYGRRLMHHKKRAVIGGAVAERPTQDAMCGTDDAVLDEAHAPTPLPAQIDARRRAREETPYVGKEFFAKLLPKPPGKPRPKQFTDTLLRRLFPLHIQVSAHHATRATVVPGSASRPATPCSGTGRPMSPATPTAAHDALRPTTPLTPGSSTTPLSPGMPGHGHSAWDGSGFLLTGHRCRPASRTDTYAAMHVAPWTQRSVPTR